MQIEVFCADVFQSSGGEALSERQLSEVREPQQERSRKRTNQILDAAQQIILERRGAGGTTSLTTTLAEMLFQVFRPYNAIYT